MAISPLKSKALHHGRSLSLPLESHSTISQFDENLSRLQRASEATCPSMSSINSSINDLKNLYDNVNDLILLPQNQIISQDSQEKCFDQILDDYSKLLDGCSTVKNLISLTKQDLRELLPSVRRKDANGIHSYLTSRRKSKKTIQKSWRNLRNVSSVEKDSETTGLVYMLKNAEPATSALLKSLLASVMGTDIKERKSGWSMVSRLMQSKKVAHQREGVDFNEFKTLDSFLQLTSVENSTEVEEVVNRLKEMDSSIQILEEELECLFRRLIKTRVFLLNISNQ